METSNSNPARPYHGKIFKLASRGQYCVDGVNKNCQQISDWILNGLEAGKFFPETKAGISDSLAKEDVPNVLPPSDGKIASAGKSEAAVLDEQSATRWVKHTVRSGEEIELQWSYHAKHATRRWNYFITKNDWDPEKPLSRAQFESTPFYKVELTAKPYWSHEAELMPNDPTVHRFKLPEREGYHVILGVWEVANTGNAFYQVIDVEFK